MEHMFSIWDRYWVLAQWWTSVSFGLILVAFVAARRLTPYLLVAIIGLYAGYTMWVYSLFLFNLEVAFAYLEDLQALEASGHALTLGTKTLMSSPHYQRGEMTANILLPATFLACCGYLVYSYLDSRKKPANPD